MLKFQKKPNLHSELVARLESRLDAVLTRSGLCRTVGEAAQKISHRKVRVDGKSVNIRSLQVRPGSVVEIDGSVTVLDGKEFPPYLAFLGGSSFRFLRQPTIKEIPYEVPIDFTKVISALR